MSKITQPLFRALAVLVATVSLHGTAQAAKPYIPRYYDLKWQIAGTEFRVEVVGRLADAPALGQEHITGQRVRVTVGRRRIGVDLDWKLAAVALVLTCLTFLWFRSKRRNKATHQVSRHAC